jgi:hypothetical protein
LFPPLNADEGALRDLRFAVGEELERRMFS